MIRLIGAGDLTILNEDLYGTTIYRVEDTDTSTVNASIRPGEILNKFGSGTGTTAAASGNLVRGCIDPGANGIGADGIDLLMGIAKGAGTETETLSGTVDAYILGFGTRFRGRATTPGSMNTVSELNGLLLDNVTIDGITGITGNSATTPYTIDENDTDDPNVHAFQILVGDIVEGTLEVRVCAGLPMFGNGI